MPYANNKGAGQPAQISAFVVRCQNSIVPLVSIVTISLFLLASVAEEVPFKRILETFSHISYL